MSNKTFLPLSGPAPHRGGFTKEGMKENMMDPESLMDEMGKREFRQQRKAESRKERVGQARVAFDKIVETANGLAGQGIEAQVGPISSMVRKFSKEFLDSSRGKVRQEIMDAVKHDLLNHPVIKAVSEYSWKKMDEEIKEQSEKEDEEKARRRR
jgi:hypothetical protein